MQDKLKCYEEALAIDPGSKLFFPLAKLYLDNEQIEKAEEVLRSGLEKYPEHLEAKLLLAHICVLQGNKKEGEKICASIFSLLNGNNLFWSVLEDFFVQKGDVDLALALRFLALHARGERLTWGNVLNAGLLALESSEGTGHESGAVEVEAEQIGDRESGSRAVFAGPAEVRDKTGDVDLEINENMVEKFDDVEEVKDLNFEQEARTISLADLLFEQEEYAKALDIYEELLQTSISDVERKELESRINEIKGILAGEESASGDSLAMENDEYDGEKSVELDGQSEVIDFLSRLAERLEARAQRGIPQ